jgi:hypothetical protein
MNVNTDRHTWCVAGVAGRAGRNGSATAAGARAFRRSFGMVFANPSSVVAARTDHAEVRAGLRELHERPALMQYQPAFLNRAIEAALVLGRRNLQLKQHRPVDLLDIDATVLDGLEFVGDLDDLSHGLNTPSIIEIDHAFPI